MTNRITVIQKIIKKIDAHTYLEIGTSHGECFLKIIAPKKIAVDPDTKINWLKRIFYGIGNISNLRSRYIQLTSDQFFIEEKQFLEKHGLDVVFIDGLHTYEQSLKDVQNGLKFLNPGGVIVMHDCNPKDENSAITGNSLDEVKSLNLNDWAGEWCGDVWKTIANLRSTRRDLNIFVLDCDFGLGIITQGKPKNILNFSISKLKKLSYSDIEQDRENILNLMTLDYLDKFLDTLS